jgi:hypothetical protein
VTDAEIRRAAEGEAVRFALLLEQYRDACLIVGRLPSQGDRVRAAAAGLLMQQAQDAIQTMHAETVGSALKHIVRAAQAKETP